MSTLEGNRKIARKLLGDDPLYYVKLGRKGGKSSSTPIGTERARELVRIREAKKKNLDNASATE